MVYNSWLLITNDFLSNKWDQAELKNVQHSSYMIVLKKGTSFPKRFDSDDVTEYWHSKVYFLKPLMFLY